MRRPILGGIATLFSAIEKNPGYGEGVSPHREKVADVITASSSGMT